MELASLTDVKNHLGIAADNTAEDDRLRAWLSAAIASVKNVCTGIDFDQITRTEYHEPDGYYLRTKFRPVRSITSIYEDTAAMWGDGTSPYPSNTLLTAGSDYALHRDGSGINGDISRSGTVRRLGKPWARRLASPAILGSNAEILVKHVEPSIGAVKIVYASGYLAVPRDITQAVCFEVDAMRSMAGKGGQVTQSESLGEYSYTNAGLMHPMAAFGRLLSHAAMSLVQPYLGMTWAF